MTIFQLMEWLGGRIADASGTALKRLRLLMQLVAAVGLFAGIQAVAHAAPCSFQVNSGLSIVFTTPGRTEMDPSAIGQNATGTASGAVGTSRWGSCSNTTMSMTVTGTQTLVGAGTVIPYSLTLPAPVTTGPGDNSFRPFTLTGTVLWADFANAPAGSYTGSVTINVNP